VTRACAESFSSASSGHRVVLADALHHRRERARWRHVGNEYFLNHQNDHAILAGQLAQHFGNDRFATPEPRESVLTGVRMHDAGWPLHDDEPTLNKAHHPLDVFEVPRSIG